MKMRDLIAQLASEVSPAEHDVVPRLLNRTLMHGMAGNAALLVALYVVRNDMPELMLTSMFWTRLAFPLAVVAAPMKFTEQLGRLGAPLRLAWFAVALPIGTMLLAAGTILLITPPGYRLQLMLGTTWRATTGSIVLLSLPSLVAMMQAMK